MQMTFFVYTFAQFGHTATCQTGGVHTSARVSFFVFAYLKIFHNFPFASMT